MKFMIPIDKANRVQQEEQFSPSHISSLFFFSSRSKGQMCTCRIILNTIAALFHDSAQQRGEDLLGFFL